jgi:hypothetical protein
MINIISKRCIYEGCKTQSNFNFEGQQTGLYCGEHKLDRMMNIKAKRCEFDGCKTQPNFNFEGQPNGLYCNQHKKDEMIDVKSKRCKTYLCYTFVSEKYDGYCLRCYIHLFPDKPVSRNYKTKETTVVEYITNHFPQFSWISDKTIQGGCSKKRPDLICDLGYQVIIVEIDENQHIDYDCSCENKRIMELSQDVGHRPIIFIRFNPDDYENKEKNITSCWGINKNGICVIKKTKKEEWNERLQALKSQIEYWSNEENKTEKTVEIIQLFYNQ